MYGLSASPNAFLTNCSAPSAPPNSATNPIALAAESFNIPSVPATSDSDIFFASPPTATAPVATRNPAIPVLESL